MIAESENPPLKTTPEKPEPSAATPVSRPLSKRAYVSETEPVEVGGPKGPEPTRFGDWEQKGRCTDF